MRTTETSDNDYRYGTRTDIGLKRQRNEDFLTVRRTRHGLLLVVCDGMGGHAAGDRASSLAAEVFASTVEASDENGSGTAEDILQRGLAAANDALADAINVEPTLRGMGTTVVAALLQGSQATLINIGDSRAYWFHNGRIARITNDHSLVGEMVRRGEITEAEAAIHPRRNIITRVLGGNDDLQEGGDIFKVELFDNDVLLLATDGLHGMISDSAIVERLASGRLPEQLVDDLVEDALAAGGDDNVTLIVATLAAPGSPRSDPDTVIPSAGDAPTSRRSVRITLLLLFGIPLLIIVTFVYILPGFNPMSDSTVDSLRVADTLRGSDSVVHQGADSTRSTIPPWERGDDSLHVGDTIDIL
jgi:protein phosphatase